MTAANIKEGEVIVQLARVGGKLARFNFQTMSMMSEFFKEDILQLMQKDDWMQSRSLDDVSQMLWFALQEGEEFDGDVVALRRVMPMPKLGYYMLQIATGMNGATTGTADAVETIKDLGRGDMLDPPSAGAQASAS